MKKLNSLSTILLFITILVFVSSCETFDLFEDKCEKDNMPRISRTFTLSIQIKYKDGMPFDGKTEFYIVKERCDGTQSGYFETSGTPDANGIYIPNIEPLYSFNNKQDKVFFRFTAYHTPYYPANEVTEVTGETFNYDKAETGADDYDEISKRYYITIPTNSDGTN